MTVNSIVHPTVTIACDVDGVIAPITIEPDSKVCAELPRVMHGTHVLTAAVAALKHWHLLGAQMMWHTTWRPPYTDDLATTLALPNFNVFASDDEYLRPTPPTTWWKLAAIQRWLRERPADSTELLIWLDDDIADAIASGEIPVEMLEDPRLLVISPQSRLGLSTEEIKNITNLVRSERTTPSFA